MPIIRVKIIDPNHPHYGEYGHLRLDKGEIKVKKIGHHRRVEVELENCTHGARACYVEPKYIEHLDIVIEPEACGYHCHQTEKYGFVPEAGCPVHDSPNKVK